MCRTAICNKSSRTAKITFESYSESFSGRFFYVRASQNDSEPLAPPRIIHSGALRDAQRVLVDVARPMSSLTRATTRMRDPDEVGNAQDQSLLCKLGFRHVDGLIFTLNGDAYRNESRNPALRCYTAGPWGNPATNTSSSKARSCLRSSI